MTIQPGELGHIIQLATAPVFLLTGVGTNMLVLTNRLARIIDRTRVLEERLVEGAPTISDKARAVGGGVLEAVMRGMHMDKSED